MAHLLGRAFVLELTMIMILILISNPDEDEDSVAFHRSVLLSLLGVVCRKCGVPRGNRGGHAAVPAAFEAEGPQSLSAGGGGGGGGVTTQRLLDEVWSRLPAGSRFAVPAGLIVAVVGGIAT